MLLLFSYLLLLMTKFQNTEQ